ncbi:MAG TPA: Glu/Leu/Phe/Val dehydrogenase dimerization domain-containing protein [Longimicrobiales bacterium]|nr:Glu/Leu/Phe/Val dehydrogenase dimerization domain-containing protein [Longimicrobiales bacterium]
MWRRYASFLRKTPELTLAWSDRETDARAWLVINSLRGGAAGGGTRMRLGVNPREVTYLAKAMELKFSISGPPIGGAKTGIDFDPSDTAKADVLERWYRAAMPVLRDRYGTGGDLNIDEVLDVIPAFERLGLHHPQEGVVRGHLGPDDRQFRAIMERMQSGVAAPIEPGAADTRAVDGVELAIADVITGYGVAASVRRLYEGLGSSLEGVRVLLEGFGNVGAAAGLYLARQGARIVAIKDARSTLIDEAGVDADGVEDLLRRREGKLLPSEDPRVHDGLERSRFWGVPADVFVCAAISESVTSNTLDELERSGVSVIACGSNQPFREVKIGSTLVAQEADRRFSVIADILANCGMARTFSYLMESNAQPSAEPVFAAVNQTIEHTLDEVLDRAGGARTGLLSATLGFALDRIGA